MSFECCGVPAALNSCIEVTIPGGTVCVVANMPKQVPLNLQVACRHEVPLLGDLGTNIEKWGGTSERCDAAWKDDLWRLGLLLMNSGTLPKGWMQKVGGLDS